MLTKDFIIIIETSETRRQTQILSGVRYLQIPLFLFLTFLISKRLPYFFGYKMELFSFQNKPKDLDPSYKMDLDLWDCLGRVKLVLYSKIS